MQACYSAKQLRCVGYRFRTWVTKLVQDMGGALLGEGYKLGFCLSLPPGNLRGKDSPKKLLLFLILASSLRCPAGTGGPPCQPPFCTGLLSRPTALAAGVAYQYPLASRGSLIYGPLV